MRISFFSIKYGAQWTVTALESLIKTKAHYFKHIEIILADWGDLQEIAKHVVYEIYSLYLKTELQTKISRIQIHVMLRTRRSAAEHITCEASFFARQS